MATKRPVHNHGPDDPPCGESLIGDCLRAELGESVAVLQRELIAARKRASRLRELIYKRYPVEIFWSHAERGYIARSREMPTISAFGETRAAALSEMEEALLGALEIIEQDGYD